MPRFLPDPEYPHIAKQLRKLESHHFSGPVFKYPIHCDDLRMVCSACGNEYEPPWAEPLPAEYAPIASDVAKGAWIPSGVPISCPVCSHEDILQFPNAPNKTNHFVTLYGDEASYRFSKHSFMYVYVFYSSLGRFKAKIVEAVNEAKRLINPNKEPHSWTLHVTEVRESRWRKKNRIQLSIQEINRTLLDLCAVVASAPNERVISSTVYPPHKNDPSLKAIRLRVLEAAFFTSTDYVTRAGHHLAYVLESMQNISNRNVIDYDVELVSRSLRRNLAYLYTCRTRHVILPVTEPKGFDVDMEVADLIAYIVRRYLYTNSINRHTELPVESIGPIFWSVFTPRHVVTETTTGFPWQKVMEYTSRELAE